MFFEYKTLVQKYHYIDYTRSEVYYSTNEIKNIAHPGSFFG